ncbi:hypothetical protein GCM10017044_28640 [Kordiimonas sediminis]|uniref:Uncharacterized protein n=1 Tax=Kordiimonas sediminis TaxID=1735581 RepID=A0A919AZI6_9PROT|nr:hypothetical protein GCM10017044_28640 [Kordiimonas sediminis]
MLGGAIKAYSRLIYAIAVLVIASLIGVALLHYLLRFSVLWASVPILSMATYSGYLIYRYRRFLIDEAKLTK